MSNEQQKETTSNQDQKPNVSFLDGIISFEEFTKRKAKYNYFRDHRNNSTVTFPEYIRFNIVLLKDYLNNMQTSGNETIDVHFGIDDNNTLTVIYAPSIPSEGNCYDQGEVHHGMSM